MKKAILIGRESENAREVFRAHADELERRGIVDATEALVYGSEPSRELAEELQGIREGADEVYAVPMFMSHSPETSDAIPRALSYVEGDVRYCDPVGESRAVTEAIEERVREAADDPEDCTAVLVGRGSDASSNSQRAAERHADRLRREGGFGEVVTCYVHRNPTVECVRYSITNEEAVAVPLFVSRNRSTERDIPDKLELGRGGIEYTDVPGGHPKMVDAIHSEIEKGDALERGMDAGAGIAHPPVADGEGKPEGESDRG